jgi:hypothetical protein
MELSECAELQMPGEASRQGGEAQHDTAISEADKWRRASHPSIFKLEAKHSDP